jgi:hypothetical protein
MSQTCRATSLLGRLLALSFLARVGLQALDLHSTLTAGPGQIESNKLIQAIATTQWISAPTAVLLVKACSTALVAVLFGVWRTSRQLDREFAICLTALLLVYGLVVANNYLAR